MARIDVAADTSQCASDSLKVSLLSNRLSKLVMRDTHHCEMGPYKLTTAAVLPAVYTLTASCNSCLVPKQRCVVGAAVVGVVLGFEVGDALGNGVGGTVGVAVGCAVGIGVGICVGTMEGRAVGATVGCRVGARVGDLVVG